MKSAQNEVTQEPIRAFILNEFNFAVSLVTFIHKTLVEINKIVRSSVSTNEATISLIITIVNQKVIIPTFSSVFTDVLEIIKILIVHNPDTR